jgi:Ca2+-binding EF-hand superfamily protein
MEKVRQKIAEAFEEADIDGDGVLNREQLTMLMRKMKKDIIGEDTDPRPAAIDWVMELADRSGDGKLSLREVEKAISVYAGYLQERDFIDGIFDKYDKNKDQVLDRDELREYCQELNEAGPGTDAAVHPKRLNL